jgi:hypothetical protein
LHHFPLRICDIAQGKYDASFLDTKYHFGQFAVGQALQPNAANIDTKSIF